jgi:CrcB protein
MKTALIIGLGGGIGSILRYALQVFMVRHVPVIFPLGTFLVNISGCFVIGLFYGLSVKYTFLNTEWRLFLITGICGGYTTFSSFSYESVSLFRQGAYFNFVLYVLSSVLLGLLATIAGGALSK